MKAINNKIEPGVPTLEDIGPGLDLYMVQVTSYKDFYTACPISKILVTGYPRTEEYGIVVVPVSSSDDFVQEIYLRDRGIFPAGQFKPYNYSRVFTTLADAEIYYKQIDDAKLRSPPLDPIDLPENFEYELANFTNKE